MPKKLYVGGLPWAVTSDELESIFQEHGSVLNACVVQDRDTGRSKTTTVFQHGLEVVGPRRTAWLSPCTA